MSTTRDEVRRLLDELPDDASFADIHYHIYVREKIEMGRRAVREGRVVDQAEAESEISASSPGV